MILKPITLFAFLFVLMLWAMIFSFRIQIAPFMNLRTSEVKTKNTSLLIDAEADIYHNRQFNDSVNSTYTSRTTASSRTIFKFSFVYDGHTTVGPKTIFKFQQNYCNHVYGEIAIFQIITRGYYYNKVFNALQTMQCYAKMRNYTLYQVEIEDGKIVSGFNDTGIDEKCKQYPPLVMRHCIIAYLLAKYDYIIHIDGDTGVINPNHCFEEYIRPNVDMFLLQRVHTGEIQAGHYIVKNTDFSKQFLLKWINTNTDGSDNHALQYALSVTFLDTTTHERCWDSGLPYFKKLYCIYTAMRLERKQSRLLVYERAQTFARDAWVTNFYWSEQDFLLHAMKDQDDILFTRKLTRHECDSNQWTMPIEKKFYVNSTVKMKLQWNKVDEKWFGNNLYAIITRMDYCWPGCLEIIF